MTVVRKGITVDAQGREWRGGKRLWTAAEDQLLRDRYPHEMTCDIAAALGRTVAGTYQRAKLLNVEKSDAYYAGPASTRMKPGDGRGGATRFKPGQTPPNKGLRRPGWFRGRMRETQFKKGWAPLWQPVGSRRDVGGYVFIKLADVRHAPWNHNWYPEHIITWEWAHGRPLPRGYALCFRNGDRTDLRLDNLELVHRRDLMRRNSIHNLPAPVAQAMHALGALKRQIRRLDHADPAHD